jgi:hypothetical protein
MGIGTSRSGENKGKGYRRMNIMQTLYTFLCTWKMIPVETIPGMGGGEDKGE